MPSGYFEPWISYRLAPNGGGIQQTAIESSPELLKRSSSILFLIHGYNNDQPDASSAFNRFAELQMELGAVRANLVGVYWPGDNWENGAYYMQAIGKVKALAPRFARDIRAAAAARGYLRIDIIAHSLGCRLALEVLRELADNPSPALVIGKIIFMAAAVPTFYFREGRPLRAAYAMIEGSKSLYSEADRVLHWAFPLGQSLMGEGFFPTALGRTEWIDASRLWPTMEQRRNVPSAGHSDYWGGSSKNTASLRNTAREVRSFIDIGSLPPRDIPSRAVPIRTTTESRVSAERQSTSARLA